MTRRVRVLALTTLAWLPASAGAAEVTRIASSFEAQDPFGIYFDVGFERSQHRSKLVREAHQQGTLEDVNELRFVDIRNTLDVEAHIGLWKDLELTIGVPFVLDWSRRYSLPVGTDASNSTALNNCIDARGELLDPNCATSGVGAQPLYDPGTRARRRGLGDLRFGLAYGIFNQQKDDTKPTWVLGFTYSAPTAKQLDPSVATSKEARGDVGDKVHRYTFWTAFSRRMGPADPYLKLHYTLPVRGPNWYSNCDNPDPASSAHPENCALEAWGRKAGGIRAPHVGGVVFGTEMITYENVADGSRVSFDFRGLTNYVSEGRYYNPLSDLFGKLMHTGEYLEVGGRVGLNATATENASLLLGAGLNYRTEYLVSGEKIGKDLNGNGTVDVLADTAEFNPSYDARVDSVSRRFRSVENYVFTVDATLSISF